MHASDSCRCCFQNINPYGYLQQICVNLVTWIKDIRNDNDDVRKKTINGFQPWCAVSEVISGIEHTLANYIEAVLFTKRPHDRICEVAIHQRNTGMWILNAITHDDTLNYKIGKCSKERRPRSDGCIIAPVPGSGFSSGFSRRNIIWYLLSL